MSATSEHVPSERSSGEVPPERTNEIASPEGTALPFKTEEDNTLPAGEPAIVPAASHPDPSPKEPPLDQISVVESGNESTPALPKAGSSTHDTDSIDDPEPAQPVAGLVSVQPVAQPDVNPVAPGPPAKAARRLKFSSFDEIFDWLMMTAVGIWLLFTLLYAWDVATASTNGPLFSSVRNPARATLDLRILAEGVTYGLSMLLAHSTAIVQWSAASTERGVTFSTWLAMSPGTDYLGLLRLLRWKYSNTGRDLHYQWIILR